MGVLWYGLGVSRPRDEGEIVPYREPSPAVSLLLWLLILLLLLCCVSAKETLGDLTGTSVERGSPWGWRREEEEDGREDAGIEERETWRATTNGRDDEDEDEVEEEEEEDIGGRGMASSATSENSLSWGPRTRT